MKIHRLQPPVGYRVPLFDVATAAARALVTSGARTQLEKEAADYFGVRRAFAVCSGKAALTIALKALHSLTGRRKVILPAYTCYSVPSAIVKAGLIPVPVDIGRGTFDYDYEELQAALNRDVLCALSVHLFGIPSDTYRLKRHCERHGIFVVEDAAQAMGATSAGELLGTRSDVGFFSLGRGKNITCGSGGVIVTKAPDITASLQRSVAHLASPGRARDVKTVAELSAMSVFISPALYWFPAGIPALKLGETIFHADFPVRFLSDTRAQLLRGWRNQLARLNAFRLEAAAFYREHVHGTSYSSDHDVPFLRYPMLVEAAPVRERILREGRAYGIGVMYPASVGAIPEISALLTRHRYPEAERVATSLITLPTHPILTERDRSKVCELVNASGAGTAAVAHNPRAAVS